MKASQAIVVMFKNVTEQEAQDILGKMKQAILDSKYYNDSDDWRKIEDIYIDTKYGDWEGE